MTSSDYSVLAEVKKLNSDIKTGYVLSAAYGAYYSISYVDVISINYSFVNKALVDSVHRYGKELYVWTVNAPSIVKSLANMGVDILLLITRLWQGRRSIKIYRKRAYQYT